MTKVEMTVAYHLPPDAVTALYDLVEAPTADAVLGYYERGLHPGACIANILCNDLWMAVVNADRSDATHLADLTHWIYVYLPHSARGNEERFRNWMEMHSRSKQND